MSFSKKTIIVYLIALAFLLPVVWASADDTLTVVADQANKDKSQRWLDFLTQNEIEVVFCAPADFESVKGNSYIAIIGGVDDAAVKKLVTEAAGADEAAAMVRAGASKILVKAGVWAPGQKVLIFTGSDSQAAAEARLANRDKWMSVLEDWFALSEGPGALKSY